VVACRPCGAQTLGVRIDDAKTYTGCRNFFQENAYTVLVKSFLFGVLGFLKSTLSVLLFAYGLMFRGGAALSVALQLSFLAFYMFGNAASYAQLPQAFLKNAYSVYQNANSFVSFLVLTIITIGSVLYARAQTFSPSSPMFQFTQRAGHYFLVGGYTLLLAGLLVFLRQLINDSDTSLGKTGGGWIFDVMRYCYHSSRMLSFLVGLGSAYYFFLGVANLEFGLHNLDLGFGAVKKPASVRQNVKIVIGTVENKASGLSFAFVTLPELLNKMKKPKTQNAK
jgi:hypothetical protein